MHIEIQNCFSFWGTSVPRPRTGASPLDPTRGLLSPRPPSQDIPHILYQVYAPVSKASAFRFVWRAVCSPYSTVNLRRPSFSSRRRSDLELSSAARHIHAVTSCLPHSLEDILLPTVLFIIVLSCRRSYIVILDTSIVLLTYLLTYWCSLIHQPTNLETLECQKFMRLIWFSEPWSSWDGEASSDIFVLKLISVLVFIWFSSQNFYII